MSKKELVRRTKVGVAIGGVNISADVNRYLQSLSYTDNEAEEADDLQIKMDDAEGLWLCKWLNTMIQKAAAAPPTATQAAPSGSWSVGQAVVVSGRPQYSSYGNGTPGDNLTNHHGTITHLNLQNGIPYPIHVDQLGWFAENQVTTSSKNGSADSQGSEAGVKGLHISATIMRENWNSDGKDLMLDCGLFELDSIDVSGPPGVVTIKGVSRPFKSGVRQTKKSKAWENYTLKGIAADMASNNGLKLMYESSQDPDIARAEQVNQSDIGFLQMLCKRYGISLKATSNMMVLFDQSEYEAKASIKTIKRGKSGGYIKFKLRTGESDTQYGACHVKYTNPSTGSVVEATYTAEKSEKDSPTLEIRQKVNNVWEAKQLAEKMLRLKNKYEYSADFTFPGDPTLLAGKTVQLVDWGGFSGKYIISQAKHQVGSSGYTTTIKLRKALEGY